MIETTLEIQASDRSVESFRGKAKQKLGEIDRKVPYLRNIRQPLAEPQPDGGRHPHGGHLLVAGRRLPADS